MSTLNYYQKINYNNNDYINLNFFLTFNYNLWWTLCQIFKHFKEIKNSRGYHVIYTEILVYLAIKRADDLKSCVVLCHNPEA